MPFVRKQKGGLAEGVACFDPRLPGFDDTVGCLSTDCFGDCIGCLRYASPCDPTCKSMGFASCPVTTTVDDCSCTDGTTQPHSIITGVWVGFSDAPAGHTLAEMARLSCDGDATTKWRLFGSVWDFTAHATSTNMNCVKSTAGLDPLPWGSGGLEVETDLAAGPLSICDGGAVFFTAGDFGITTIPTPGGTGSDCTQEGGHEMLLAEVQDNCGNTLVLCPFGGVIGAQFRCVEFDRCCRWSISFATVPGECEASGVSDVTVNATRTLTCECPPTATLIFDPGGPRETSYLLTGTSMVFSHTITPCTPGESINVTLRLDYLGCLDCDALNGDYPLGPLII